MPPDPEHPFDPEDIPYFFDNWCSLPWTPWVPFSADKHAFYAIPHEPGLYRIRPAGKDYLMYIGETRRSLHQRLHNLRMELRNRDLMPWSDPHTEAPGLWAWKDAEDYESKRSSDLEEEKDPQDASKSDRSSDRKDVNNPQDTSKSDRSSDRKDVNNPQDASKSDRSSDLEEEKSSSELFEYECSAAPLDASTNGRKGMETFLLYKYRQERGESPLCNFGRFHPRYRKSKNRKEGLRGGKLAEDHKDNPAGWPGIEPLEATGKPGESNWMGLEWTEWKPLAAEDTREVAAGAGLYLLADAGSQEIVYIGQSADVAKRLLDQSRKTGEGKSLQFSYQIIGLLVLPHHLKELENDLMGNYFENYRKAPEFQFRNSKGSSEP